MYNVHVNYKDFFKNKKIAVIGLGPHGEMIADIKFLLKNKAEISLFDTRSEIRVKKYLYDLSIGGLNKYSFGKIKEDDLLGFDIILTAYDVSRHSSFLKKAIESGIQIEYPETMFLKLIPPITIIGVMGVYGKSTVSQLIYGMLKKSFAEYDDQGLFFIDPESTNGALTHLKKIKKGDVLLLRIPEYLISYLYEMRMSPQVSVITSPVSFELLEFQTYNNFIVATDEVIDSIKEKPNLISKAKMLRVRPTHIPEDWIADRKNIHNIINSALALQTSELFKVDKSIAREIIMNFSGLKGHIELVKKINNIEFYNDSASISPQAILAALRYLSQGKNIVLIFGGAYTGYDYSELISNLSEYVSTIIVLPGSGTIGLRKKMDDLKNINIFHALDIDQAVKIAKENAKKGDKVLFSPGFNAIGVYISRKDRGEGFIKAVRNL